MSNELCVTVQEQDVFAALTNLNNPAFVESIADIFDVDVTTNGKVNGSILVYNGTTNKWTSTTILDAQDVTGGHY